MTAKLALTWCIGLGIISFLLGAEDASWERTSEHEVITQLLIDESSLKDPFSVRFRKVFVNYAELDDATLWCGQINAKNSYGAYGGFSRFFLIKKTGEESEFMMQDDEDAETVVRINKVCAGTLQAQTVNQSDVCGVIRESNEDTAPKLDRPSQIRARHILLRSESAAFEVIRKLQAGGNFAVLAKTLSTGPSGKNGGDLGWFQPNAMPPAFANAVLQLEDCEYRPEPVSTEFGWHVILRLESR